MFKRMQFVPHPHAVTWFLPSASTRPSRASATLTTSGRCRLPSGTNVTYFSNANSASSSWDWGPAFPSVGIWRPLYLESYSLSVLRHAKWTAERDGGDGSDWTCHLDLVFEKDPRETLITGEVSVELEGVFEDTFPVTLEEKTTGN